MKNGISFSLSLADSTNAKYESVLSSTLMDFPHIERDTENYRACQRVSALLVLRSILTVEGLLPLPESLKRNDTCLELSLFLTAMYGPAASQPIKNVPASPR